MNQDELLKFQRINNEVIRNIKGVTKFLKITDDLYLRTDANPMNSGGLYKSKHPINELGGWNRRARKSQRPEGFTVRKGNREYVVEVPVDYTTGVSVLAGPHKNHTHHIDHLFRHGQSAGGVAVGVATLLMEIDSRVFEWALNYQGYKDPTHSRDPFKREHIKQLSNLYNNLITVGKQQNRLKKMGSGHDTLINDVNDRLFRLNYIFSTPLQQLDKQTFMRAFFGSPIAEYGFRGDLLMKKRKKEKNNKQKNAEHAAEKAAENKRERDLEQIRIKANHAKRQLNKMQKEFLAMKKT